MLAKYSKKNSYWRQTTLLVVSWFVKYFFSSSTIGPGETLAWALSKKGCLTYSNHGCTQIFSRGGQNFPRRGWQIHTLCLKTTKKTYSSHQSLTRPVLDRFHDSSKVNALCFMLYALWFMLYTLCSMLEIFKTMSKSMKILSK